MFFTTSDTFIITAVFAESMKKNRKFFGQKNNKESSSLKLYL